MGKLSIVKISVLPNLRYRFGAIPIKIPGSSLVNTNKLILESGRPRRVDPVLKGKDKVGGPTLPCAEAHDARRKARRSRRRGAGEGADRAVAGAGWTVGRHRRGRGEGNAREQRRSPQQRCWGSWTSTCEDRNLHADLTPFTRSAQNGPRT